MGRAVRGGGGQHTADLHGDRHCQALVYAPLCSRIFEAAAEAVSGRSKERIAEISRVTLRCLRQRAILPTIAVTPDGKELSRMLSENIKAIRKAKGLSQQELAVKLNVVRQTISKWEQGLSVPDSDLLLSLSEALETPVSTLLGETVTESEADAVEAIAEKLEILNLQLARRRVLRRSILQIIICNQMIGDDLKLILHI